MEEIVKEYKKGGLTIVWKPGACIHSTICWKAATGLPAVFNPFEKPWIKPEEASEEELIRVIKKCPSGALSYYIGESAVRSGESAVQSGIINEGNAESGK